MKVKVAQMVANMYRDMGNYPISQQKVDSLKESIQQTDFWDNLLARPEGNVIDPSLLNGKTVSDYLKGLSAAFTEDGTFLFKVELAYGHHRLEACRQLGIEEIDIPVKEIEHQTMLKIMANENKGDWASNMSVILETVRQAKNFLADTVAPFATYEEYAKAGNSFFSKEQFAQLPAQGIGFKPIQKFLGETWAENDVRQAVRVLKDIEEGLYDQSMVISFPSVGVLGEYSKVVQAIRKQPWPEFFKDKMTAEMAAMIADPGQSTTVKILKSAAGAANSGKNPLLVVRSPGQKQKEFSVVKEIKNLVYEQMDPKLKLNLDDLPTVDGFKDYPELDKVIEEVKKSIARSEAAKKAVTTGEAQTTEDGTVITPETAADPDALEALVEGAEAEVAVASPTDGTLGVVEGEDATIEGAGELNVKAVFDRFTMSVPAMVKQTDDLAVVLNQGVETPEGGAVEGAMESLAQSVMAAFITLYGADDALSLVTNLMAHDEDVSAE